MPFDGAKIADSQGRAEKLPFELYAAAYDNRGYNEPTVQNLRRVYDLIDVNQIFGSEYFVKILGCSERTGRNLIAKLREMDVVMPVSGKGKGKYRFKYRSEMQ